MHFDHLVISCEDVDSGTDAVESALGVPLQPGGKHAAFGTHNRLLSLGGEEYLEVIAVDPGAPAPERPRWFDLDQFDGPPTLTHWACRLPDLDGIAPEVGTPLALSRDDLRWEMAVTETGRLPFDNLHPALLAWQSPHPAPKLTDRKARLARLVVVHPEAKALRALLPGLEDRRIHFEPGPAQLLAEIDTPTGRWTLT